MSRPKINIPFETSDYVIEIVGLVFLILLVGFPAFYFSELPEVIPKHFDALGNPDGFGSKNGIWFMPVSGFVLYLSLIILNRYPHIFNYPTEITEENAIRQYRLATKMIRSLNLVTAISFCYITYQTIQTSLNISNGLGFYTLPILVLVTASVIGLYMYQALKKKTD